MLCANGNGKKEQNNGRRTRKEWKNPQKCKNECVGRWQIGGRAMRKKRGTQIVEGKGRKECGKDVIIWNVIKEYEYDFLLSFLLLYLLSCFLFM